MSNDRQLTEEFEKLSARLSPQLDAARTEIREADRELARIEAEQNARRRCLRDGVWKSVLWSLVMLSGPILTFSAGETPVGITLMWISLLNWLWATMCWWRAVTFYGTAGGGLLHFRDERGTHANFGRPMSERNVDRVQWYLALPYFLWLRYWNLMLARREERPALLADDRLEELRRLFENIDAWDDDVKYVNRILIKVEQGIVPREDVHRLVANLREDERYLLSLVRCSERLMEEGPLGTSLSKSTMPLVDRLDDRMTLVDTHRREAREFSGRIAGRMEVVRHK